MLTAQLMPMKRPPKKILARAVILSCALAAFSCRPSPARFVELDLAAARELAASATVLEVAVESAPSAPSSPRSDLRWEVAPAGTLLPPQVPEGPILVVAPNAAVGYRSAAALARAGNLEIRLVIVGSAKDRHSLFAEARHARE